jgi:hypothetical protein
MHKLKTDFSRDNTTFKNHLIAAAVSLGYLYPLSTEEMVLTAGFITEAFNFLIVWDSELRVEKIG